MLSEDRLNELGVRLKDLRSRNPAEFAALEDAIRDVFESTAYQNWLDEGQYNSYMSARARFDVPADFGIGLERGKKHLLERYGLLNGSQLTVKIDSHRGRLHFTDGNWVPSTVRVFPYCDESEILCKFAEDRGWLNDADLLIDPACGCGHHALGVQQSIDKACFDVSTRALAYARINSVLANDSNVLFAERSIESGLHPIMKRVVARHTVILVNMPFAIFPKSTSSKRMAQDGGDRGIKYTLEAMKAVRAYVENARASKISAAILCYSVGDATRNSWEVLERASGIFKDFEYDFSILSEEKLWRVNGKKEQANPMPIDRLRLKGRCAHTYSADEMAAMVEGYRALERDLRNAGHSHLAYGVLSVRRP